MLDIKYLRQNIEIVRKKMDERGQTIDFDRFLEVDAKRRDILQSVETLRNERNDASKAIGELKKKKQDASELIEKMSQVSGKIKDYDEILRVTEEELNAFVMIVPNIQHESVPMGSGSEDNAVYTLGVKNQFSALNPNSISSLAKVSTFWISRAAQKSPERALRFIAGLALPWNVR